MALYDTFSGTASPASVSSFLNQIPSTTGFEDRLTSLRESGTPIDYGALTASKEREQKIFQELEQMREKALMRQAYEQTFVDRALGSDLSSDMQMASRLEQQANNFIKNGGNPTAIEDILSKASDYRKKGLEKEKLIVDNQAKKDELVAGMMADVTDQTSLDSFSMEASKLGYVLPKQYQQYNSGTKSWLNDRMMQNRKVRDAQQAQSLIVTRDAQQKLKEDSLQFNRQKEEEKRRRDIQKQNAINATKTFTTKQLMPTIGSLSDLEGFKELSQPDKIIAAREFTALSGNYALDGTAPDAASAQTMARDDIANRIREGKFIPFTAGVAPVAVGTGAPSVPAKADWLAKAKSVNPGVSEEELSRYYDTNYGQK